MGYRRVWRKLRCKLSEFRLQACLDNNLVLGFWLGHRRTLAAEAVCPGCTLIRFDPPPSRDLGTSIEETGALLQRVTALSSPRNPIVLVPGVRDRLEGHDLGSVFSTVVRVERGLLPGPASRKLLTSFIINHKGIYFDGRAPCDMEDALQALHRGYATSSIAQSLLQLVRRKRITKYTMNDNIDLRIDPTDVVIIGQVVGDQSIESSTTIGRNNLALISHVTKKAKIDNVSQYYYKPHPRNGHNAHEINLIKYNCPSVIVLDTNINIHTIFAKLPRVATMTSGAGLEAALYGCEVYTFGISFYSNWGFTIDYFVCERRTNKLTAEDVAAFIWLEWQTYVDPKSRLIMPSELVFDLG